jgi:hypothetical protein
MPPGKLGIARPQNVGALPHEQGWRAQRAPEKCLGHVICGVRGTYDSHKYEAEMRQAYEALAALIQRTTAQDNVVGMAKLR